MEASNCPVYYDRDVTLKGKGRNEDNRKLNISKTVQAGRHQCNTYRKSV